jgi:sporulation protein YlmC with PRC-barrel domain
MRKLFFVYTSFAFCMFGTSQQSFALSENPASGPLVKHSELNQPVPKNDEGKIYYPKSSSSEKSALSDDKRNKPTSDERNRADNATLYTDEPKKLGENQDVARSSDERKNTNGNQDLIRSSKITGISVKNLQDEDLGKIEEIMIDRNQGKIAYLVLSFGGFLGMGDKLFAMPLNIFNYDAKDDVYRINVTKEKLKNSPGFDKDNWPKSSDTYWSSTITEHYK